MKKLSLLPLLLFSAQAFSGEVTIPNTFRSGEKAIAAEVNENFDALAAEVNDNNARIVTKQNRVTGECPANSSIRSINEDGSVVCEADDIGGDGDITAVYTAAGSGLTGGALSGEANLAIDTTIVQKRLNSACAPGSFVRDIAEDGTPTCGLDNNTDTLGELSCSHEQIARWNANTSAWECIDGYLPTVYTQLNYTVQSSSNSISLTYQKLFDIGNFVKSYDNSIIELVWNDHANMVTSSASGFCDFQVRIDDNEVASRGARAVLYATDAPVSVTAWFPGLAAGGHTVSIWVRGIADSCTINRAFFRPAVFIKEVSQFVLN